MNSEPYVWNGVSYFSSGDYIQTFVGENGCDSVVILHLTIVTGLSDYVNPALKVYPNPTNSSIYVQMGDNPERWTIFVYDVYGQLLFQSESVEGILEIDLTQFANGLYLVVARGSGNQVLGIEKVLKK